MRKWNAIIRKEYGIDPETLTDDEWIKRVIEIKYIYELEDKRFRDNIREVLMPIVIRLYGKKK